METQHALTIRELSCILAALRNLQSRGLTYGDYYDIATNGDVFPALDDSEIDELCQRLNTE